MQGQCKGRLEVFCWGTILNEKWGEIFTINRSTSAGGSKGLLLLLLLLPLLLLLRHLH